MSTGRFRTARNYALALLPDPASLPFRPRDERFVRADVPRPVEPPHGDVRLYIAPVNFAGQAYHWARAAERLPKVGAVNMQYRTDSDLAFEADQSVPYRVFAHSGSWARAQRSAIERGFTHVLVEAQRPILGALSRGFGADIERLRERGLVVGMLSHGTDLRLPSRHAKVDEWSPFRDPSEDWVRALEQKVVGTQRVMREVGGPVFVSTPELLLDWEGAQWLPLVIDPKRWAVGPPALERSRPLVLHAPTNPRVKGTALIEPTTERLDSLGVIRYRRLARVPASEMPQQISDADIILEQFALGTYSVTAIEAMAAGRLVIGHVHEQVRRHVLQTTGREVPIVEATPTTLESVLTDVAARREVYQQTAAAGREFASEVHDGSWSAGALASFLGVARPSSQVAIDRPE